jgi:predicted RNA-binding Zn ribbon-like protein
MRSPESAAAPSVAHVFELSGGALCLDFTNTVGDRPRCDNEHLGGYGDLLAWACQAGILDGKGEDRLKRHARAHPKEVSRVFARAKELRESLYRLFSSLAVGDRPDRKDLALLNRWISEAMPNLRVAQKDDSFDWSWSESETALDRMLWSVARSAADLLTSSEADQVRECASETCSWLFVDRSRTHRRRWCDMKTCGNRNKARRYYQRKRHEGPSAPESD